MTARKGSKSVTLVPAISFAGRLIPLERDQGAKSSYYRIAGHRSVNYVLSDAQVPKAIKVGLVNADTGDLVELLATIEATTGTYVPKVKSDQVTTYTDKDGNVRERPVYVEGDPANARKCVTYTGTVEIAGTEYNMSWRASMSDKGNLNLRSFSGGIVLRSWAGKGTGSGPGVKSFNDMLTADW